MYLPKRNYQCHIPKKTNGKCFVFRIKINFFCQNFLPNKNCSSLSDSADTRELLHEK